MDNLVVIKDYTGAIIIGELINEDENFMELEYPIMIGITPEGKIVFANYFVLPGLVTKIKVKVAARVLDMDEKILAQLKSMYSEYKIQASSFQSGLSLAKDKKDIEKVARVIQKIQHPKKG